MARTSPDPARKMVEDAKKEANARLLAPDFKPPSSDIWLRMRTLWTQLTDTEKKDLISGLVLQCMAMKRDIARFFNITQKELEPFDDIIQQTTAIRKMKIQEHQVEWAYKANQLPHAKFFLGKQGAEQVENPAHEDVASLGSGNEIVLRLAEDSLATVADSTETEGLSPLGAIKLAVSSKLPN